MNAQALATQEYASGFYPTPRELANKMFDMLDMQRSGKKILEPSAGKGDLADAYIAYYNEYYNLSYRALDRKTMDIDCIEIDPDLRSVLLGKGFRVVHDDFLTFHTYLQYDLVIMNPPFQYGAQHLLKALSVMRYGGQIACILNAETIRNPYSIARKELQRKIAEYDAKVVYVENAFSKAERETNVEIAIVVFSLPAVELGSDILDGMKKAERRPDTTPLQGCVDIAKLDFFEAIIDRYEYEARCGIKLIQEYSVVMKLLGETNTPEMLHMAMGGKYSNDREDVSSNTFLVRLRKKFWSMLFESPQFISQMTSNLRDDLRRRVDSLGTYEFSAYNIYHLAFEMSQRVNDGIAKTIMKQFDDWTRTYHWDENSNNIHYFSGWKTNDAFAVNKRVIIPMYGAFSWGGRISYTAIETLSDIEKVFDYLDAGRTTPFSIDGAFRRAEQEKKTKKIQCKYFDVSLYKKGTCHIAFTNLDVLAKFNIYAAMDKKWLPPSFGKKHYRDMDAEERTTVDSFIGGEMEYERVVSDADYYLPHQETVFLLGAG